MSTPDSLVEMGYISAPFGIHGWVKIKVATQLVNALTEYKLVYLREKNGRLTSKEIEKSAVSVDLLQIKFAGIDNREQAMNLRGCTVCVKRSDLPLIQTDEYYWVDLIGLTVFNHKSEVLGKVTNLLEVGSHSVLVIKGATNELMIPFVKAYISEVNLTAKRIVAEWELDY